jgi:hypothetical protein
MTWLLIETAPKDGSWILAWNEVYGARQTRMGKYPKGSIGYAKWEAGDGPINLGWVWIEEKHNSAHTWLPTHWMPLPEPPSRNFKMSE